MATTPLSEPEDGDQREITFTATGGATVTLTATYRKTWCGQLQPCIDADGVCAILDAWEHVDQEHRHYLWPSTERSEDDTFIAYLWDGHVVLDRWSTVADRDAFSLDALPSLLPASHYRLTRAR